MYIILLLFLIYPSEASSRDKIKLLCKRTSSYNRCMSEFNRGYSQDYERKTNQKAPIEIKVIPYK